MIKRNIWKFYSKIIRSKPMSLPRTARFSSASATKDEGYYIVKKEDVYSFAKQCMLSVGTKEPHAEALAEVLLMADYRGWYSDGLRQLSLYIRDIQIGSTVCDKEPYVIKETASTALVDGCNLMGPVVGHYSMDVALTKAKQSGIGWVVARGSTHYGIASAYALRALDWNMIGISCSNTSPVMMPTRSKSVALGSNPLAVAAPARDGDSFVLDMTTSTVSLGRIEMAKYNDMPIPSSWGADMDGRQTNNPEHVIRSGGLLPLGGSHITRGYKGYGLALMVELFCGILAGSDYATHIRKWRTSEHKANIGQCFAAINPEVFALHYEERMQDLLNICRNLERVRENEPVQVPGDPERIHMQNSDQQGGIKYSSNEIALFTQLATRLNVQPMNGNRVD